MSAGTSNGTTALDFKNCFRLPLELEGRLVARWFGTSSRFHNAVNSSMTGSATVSHEDEGQRSRNRSMPFLHRNLVYIPVGNKSYSAASRRWARKTCWYNKHFPNAPIQGFRALAQLSRKKSSSFDILNLIQKSHRGVKDDCGRIIFDLDSMQEVIEIHSSDDLSVNSSSVNKASNAKSFPSYDPARDGLPKKKRKANTIYFKSVRKSVKEEVLKHFSSSLSPAQGSDKAEDMEQKLQYLIRLKMKKMWYGLDTNERKIWETKERHDERRFEHQAALYQEWFKKRKRTLFHFASFASSGTDDGDDDGNDKNGKGNLEDYTEIRPDKKCPFCLIDCRDDNGLLSHCSNIHLSLSYEGKVDRNGHLHVRVSPIPFFNLDVKGRNDGTKHNFVYCKSLCPRPKSFMLTPITTERVKPLDLTRPIRQYYHPRTMEPLNEDEWDEDSDDDDEIDSWRIKRSENLITEFEDVSPKEKIFMKLWNRYMSANHIIADKQIPERCIEFIHINYSDLRHHELRDQLLLHAFNLWDHVLISADHILKCLEAYDAELGTREEMCL